jgi:FAD/FMN-containing dehydrogenase
MMRDLVLGLEAVLADGTVVNSMHPHIKNNTGYDLKQLFIGSEGTLGIVTRAVLRLRPRLSTQCVALVAVSSFPGVLQALHRLEAHLGGRLSAFEVMWSEFYELVTTPPARSRPILARGARYYILIEALGGDTERDAVSFEAALSSLLDDGVLSDAAVAQSHSECTAIWALREEATEVKRLAPLLSFDVSLGHSAIEAFDSKVRQGLSALCPGAQLVMFGHIGDGNIHVIAGPLAANGDLNRPVTTLVYDTLCSLGGSISAEHGIGLDKREYLPLSRSAAELALMRSIKRALDPANVLNPGKILAVEPTRQ